MRLPAFAPFLLLLAAARAAAQVTELPSPAQEGSIGPNLFAAADGRILLSWIDRLPGGRHALRFSVREGSGWSAPRLVAEGADWFVNWADFPSVVALPDGTLAAHWLVRSTARHTPTRCGSRVPMTGVQAGARPSSRTGTASRQSTVSSRCFPRAGGSWGRHGWTEGKCRPTLRDRRGTAVP
jgi:hypothetical protein